MNKELEILQMIIDDCTTDAQNFDRKPFSGKTVGEMHGILEAKIEALAKILKKHIEEKHD